VLQADFTSDQLREALESSLVKGLRRAAGLNLINFGMSLSGMTDENFNGMLQWL
jgi:hypothetical protein